MDPNKRNWHQLPDRIIQSKRAENSKLISVAHTVMEELYTDPDSTFVLLSDQEGYILDSTGHGRKTPPTGLLFSEKVIGTNAIGTALAEQASVEINGAEHYCSYYHNVFSAACLLRDGEDQTIGVLAICSIGQELPAGLLQALHLGIRVIENQLDYKAELSKILQLSHNTCSAIIDIYNEPIIVVDYNYTIANINDSCLQLLGSPNRKEVVGRLIDQLILDEPQVINSLLSSDPNQFNSKFILQTSNGKLPCTLERRRVVPNPDGSQQVILVFQAVDADAFLPSGEVIVQGSVAEGSIFQSIVGESQAINNIKNMAFRAAQVQSNVLIEGESGTGKEIIAHAIHEASGRKGPFIAINCGAIPKELMQSELFGYVEGAFTGAKKGGSAGKFELADQGTVFLDEIGEMPIDMQVNLLRFLQDKKITRVGESDSHTMDVRIIAATNRNLKKEIITGRFREDLYYRLNVINLIIPPLRARISDIPVIARAFTASLCRQMKREPMVISDQAMDLFLHYDWPGNVRELRNVLENAVVFNEGTIITKKVMPSYLRAANHFISNHSSKDVDRLVGGMDGTRHTIEEGRQHQKMAATERERDEIQRLLDQYQGNITQVAKHMSLSRNTIYKKMRSYQINK